ncbi:MAG: NADH-quinone oxidoreductase subunit L [Planctomycetota bacterium]
MAGDIAVILIPWLPALAALVIALIALRDKLQPLAAPICAGAIGASFVIAMIVWMTLSIPENKVGLTVNFYDWMAFGDFRVGFSYFLDSLTMIMLGVVCGVGCLIAIYAAGYMKGDPGYWRFFTYMALFIFAMVTLVTADNLVLLFLGWEGVGVCSYLLIGYYYDKPLAVAAAKKAFIVNRIGDFGFLLGIFLCYQTYGTVEISVMLAEARENVAALGEGYTATTADLWIPFLLMIGAFGKSAQIPLYVWLPDAMAGPTPVSALVHAATMVTAGVYLIARCIPLFELSPAALPTVAVIGGCTALFAATIALCCNDLKGVFAYSTVSQLGYMFVGVGCLSIDGAVFHLFTHAFFKALLFLTAGSVMHALAGQLDIRTMGGLRHKMPVTCWLMFVGCLSLAGFPFITSGFWSKDLILGDALAYGLNGHSVYLFVTLLGVVTAFLTAFYTFRLWFTVFMGEEKFEMGDEHHHDTPETPEAEHAEGDEAHHDHGHHDEPHEMPWLPMNAPLVPLAIGAIIFGVLGYKLHWFENIITHSTADPVTASLASGHGDGHGYGHDDHGHDPHHAYLLGLDAHDFMIILSSLLAIAGIGLAAFFFWFNRALTAKIATSLSPIVKLLENKYYIDELYDYAFVQPLRRLGGLFYVVDSLVINNLIALVAWAPSMIGRGVRPARSGRLAAYSLSMVTGIAVLALLIFMAVAR